MRKIRREILFGPGFSKALYGDSCSILYDFCGSDPFSVFFTKTENICYCNNIDGIFEALKLQHIPNDWRLFIDSSKTSLKFALLHNGNKLPTIPIAHAVNTKETYEHIAHIFQLIQSSSSSLHPTPIIGSIGHKQWPSTLLIQDLVYVSCTNV